MRRTTVTPVARTRRLPIETELIAKHEDEASVRWYRRWQCGDDVSQLLQVMDVRAVDVVAAALEVKAEALQRPTHTRDATFAQPATGGLNARQLPARPRLFQGFRRPPNEML